MRKIAVVAFGFVLWPASAQEGIHFKAPQTIEECWDRKGTGVSWGDVEVCLFKRGDKQDVSLLRGGCNFDEPARNSPRCK